MTERSMRRIGDISACIAGDYRYTSRIEVWCDGETCEVRYQGTGAVGGMDGPGGAYSNPWQVLHTVPARAKAIADAVRNACNRDLIIKSYGKPTKEFVWHRDARYSPIAKGISVAKVKVTLEVHFSN